MVSVDEDFTPTEHQARAFFGGEGLGYGAASSRGHVRADNQDAFVASAPVFAVADGMGGLSRGAEAARLAVSSLAMRWSARVNPHPVAHAVNNDVLELVGGASIAGTTLVACRIEGSLATWLSIGDSRAYLLRAGRLRRLTSDQSVRRALTDLGRDFENMTPRLLNALTSYVGIAQDDLVTQTFSIDLSLGDRLLLCTDGLHSQVDADAIKWALGTGSPQESAESLVALADHAGGRDNATALVLGIGDTSG